MTIYIVGIEEIAPIFIANLRALFPYQERFNESVNAYEQRIKAIYFEIITQLTLVIDSRHDLVPRLLVTIPNMEYFRQGDDRYVPANQEHFEEACRSFGWQYYMKLRHHVPLVYGEDYIVEQVTGTYVTLRKVKNHHGN